MNDPQRFRRIVELFEAARDRDDAEREAMFESLDRAWSEALDEVRRLLAAHDRTPGPLDCPPTKRPDRS